MTSKDQPHVRGPFVSFLVNQVRSLSRSEHQHEEPPAREDPFRSPSSLSCDPLNQSPATPKPDTVLSRAVAEALIQESAKDSPHESRINNSQSNSPRIEKGIKPRPRSWFSFSRAPSQSLPVRSKSLRLLRSSEPSGIDRSLISAPTLTSTSNTKIAQEEGILKDDIPKIDTSTLKQAHKEFLYKKPWHKSSPQIQNLSDKLKSFRLPGFSKEKSQSNSPVEDMRNDGDTATVGCQVPRSSVSSISSAIEKGFARRRTETMNLCRAKINRLTGHGRIKRKSLHGDDAHDSHGAPQPSLSPDCADRDKNEYLSLKSDSDSDLAIGSLTRSFASAVNKLDFHSPSTSSMKKLKSKPSIFNVKSRSKKGLETDENKDKKDASQQKPALSMAHQRAIIRNSKLPKPSDCITHLSTVDKEPEPVHFSAEANVYVPIDPVPKYPRGVNPLSMHTDTMSFASAPARITDLPKPIRHTPSAEELYVSQLTDEEDKGEDADEDVIEDAPIYSPSMGNLSQYARPNTLASQPIQSSESGVIPDHFHGNQQGKGRAGTSGLRKSNSALSLFGRFNKGQKNQTGTSRSRNVNKKGSGAYLGSLFKPREITSIAESPKREAETSPCQRTESRPLSQDDAQVKDLSEEDLTPPNPQKRPTPRSNFTPQEQAKRFGIVGMPAGNWSDFAGEADGMESDHKN